jgi:chromosome segregation ATPase
MADKRYSGLNGLVKGLNKRLETTEERTIELEKLGQHFRNNVHERLAEIDKLESAIAEYDSSIVTSQASRDELRNEYMEASCNGDNATAQAIQGERVVIDSQLEDLKAKREQAAGKLNQTRSNLNTQRENTWEALAEIEPPDDEVFSEFIEALTSTFEGQRSNLQARLDAVARDFELPAETEQREQAERDAQRAAERAQRAKEKQELTDRRNYYGKLLNNLSHLKEPHVGHRAWVDYLERQGIEYTIQSHGHTTFIGPDHTGKQTRIEPQSIVEGVRASYYEAMHELGEEVVEPETPRYSPRLTRSNFVSVM